MKRYQTVIVHTCRVCNMELLPILVAKGKGSEIVIPKDYCDDVCEHMNKLYPNMFGKGHKALSFYLAQSDLQGTKC